MKVFFSTMDNAGSLIPTLDKAYLEKASDYTQARARSYLSGRAILQKAFKEFYKIQSLPLMISQSNGKPLFLDNRYPCFNISHSSSTICIAISDTEVGVDLEFVKSRGNLEGLIKRVLTKSEIEALSLLEKDEKLSEFTALWTLRECLIKLSGRGLVDVSAMDVDYKEKRLNYFLAPNKSKVCTVYVDDSFIEDKKGFLSVSTVDDEQIEFYKLEDNAFIKLENVKEKFTFTNIK
jgi:phosphopantetheinyl transferase